MACAIDTEIPVTGGEQDGQGSIVALGNVFCQESVRAEILLRHDRSWWPDRTLARSEETGTTLRLSAIYRCNQGPGKVYTEIRIQTSPGGKQQSGRRWFALCR